MNDLSQPLHHCYLVPTTTVAGCISKLSDRLQEIADDDPSALTLDTETLDLLDIAAARQLRSLGLQRAAGEMRCLIRGFDTATREAQNALLKIIESPAEGTHFFFVTPNADQLLETVRSRVWLLDGVCGDLDAVKIAKLTDDFLRAQSLPEAFALAEKLETRQRLRAFVKELARRPKLRKPRFRALAKSVEDAAGWSRDTGSSVKLLGQQLAIASQQSTGQA